VDRIAWQAAAVDLPTASSLVAGGAVLAVVILSVAVAIVIVRGSRSAKEPDRYALEVLRGLPDWLWPWQARRSVGRPDQHASTGGDPAVSTVPAGEPSKSTESMP
jgi:hypothetical protein